MARKVRVQYAGAIYHLMNRGDRREEIFTDDQDRQRFLETLAEACQKTGWQGHAYCLMNNHFHLVVETPLPNLVAGMKWFLGTYTSRYNRRHREFGHLFSGRYKALLVEGSGNGYLKTVCDYVHLNPARAGLLKPEEPLSSFAWSSYPCYLGPPSCRPVWLRVDPAAGGMGHSQGQRGSSAGVCGADGAAAAGGAARRVPVGGARVVCRGRAIQTGTAGAGECGARPEPLRRSGAGSRRLASGALGEGSAQADGLERGRLKGAAQGRPEKTGVGEATASSHHDVGGLARGTVEHGHPRIFGLAAEPG